MRESHIYKRFIDNKEHLILLSIYAFLFLFICSKLSPLYPSNEWADVNVYFTIGKAIFNGIPLYTKAFDPKGSLIFFIYGFGNCISGTTFIGVFLIFLLVWIIALNAIYFTALEMLDQKKSYAFLTCILFSLFPLTHMHFGGSPEELILLFQTIGIYFFASYFAHRTAKHPPYYLFVHGVLSAMIFYLKLNLTALYLFLLIGLFISILAQEGIKQTLKNLGYYLLGLATISLPICTYLLANNTHAEAFNIYIILNKELASETTFSKMLSNGIYDITQFSFFNTTTFLFFLAGIIYYPVRFLKNRIGTIAFILGSLVLCLLVFFTGIFHFYYPLPLYVFVPLGLISLFHFVSKYISIKPSKAILYTFVILTLYCVHKKIDLFDMGYKTIARQVEHPTGVSYTFSKIISKENHPTLLNLSFGDPNHIFTLCNIVPNVKFFTALNIPYRIYPTLRNEQTKYIENKEVQFITLCSNSNDVEYFYNLPALADNYTLISTYEGPHIYQNYDNDRKTWLYKRND